MLQCRNIGLAFSASGLAVFHKEAQDLSHIGLRWGWRVLLASRATLASFNHLI
jgi:hypothetical protein